MFCLYVFLLLCKYTQGIFSTYIGYVHIYMFIISFSEANLRYRELNDALERTQGQLRDAGVSMCIYVFT